MILAMVLGACLAVCSRGVAQTEYTRTWKPTTVACDGYWESSCNWLISTNPENQTIYVFPAGPTAARRYSTNHDAGTLAIDSLRLYDDYTLRGAMIALDRIATHYRPGTSARIEMPLTAGTERIGLGTWHVGINVNVQSNNSSLTLAGNILIEESLGSEMYISGDGDTTISGQISGTGEALWNEYMADGVMKAGSGELRLVGIGPNTYNAHTTIQRGLV